MKPLWNPVAILVTLAMASCAMPTRAQTVEVPPSARSEVAFNPFPPDRCEWYFVTESNLTLLVNAPKTVDQYMVEDSFGFMKNVGSRTSVGASIDVILNEGEFHYAPTARYRRWYGSQSVDLMLGYVPGETAGPSGPILTARYSPTRLVQINVGACGYRQFDYRYTDPYFRVEERKTVHGFMGIGFGGVPGVALWGVQATLVAIALAALSSWE